MKLDWRKSVRRFARTRCEVVRERDFAQLGTRAIDVSSEGLFLMTDRDGRIGDEVILSFLIPGTERWFDAEGHVARIIRGRRIGDVAMGLGIEFDRTERESQATLRMALRKLPPILPGCRFAPMPLPG
jgi:hypothetical protein